METEIKIIDKLPVERWEEFKNLRISAMENNADSFSGTLEETLKETEADWKEKLEKNVRGEDLFIFAEDNGKLIGMGRVYLYFKERFKHNATLQALFVEPEYRGRKVGEMLVNRRIELILEIPHIKNIFCEVFGFNTASIELHKKLGFEIVGVVKDFVVKDGRYYDSITFQKIVG